MSPLLPTPDQRPPFIDGDVVLQEGTAIAPSVVLVANPGSSLIVEMGACIGMGSVLHATGGALRVEAGATLGAGVLVVGQGKIGRQACIGSCATLLEPMIEEGAVIPAGTVVDGSAPAPVVPAPLVVGPVVSLTVPTVTGQAQFARLKARLTGH
ncbi:hypothetical protein [Candidatus Cyanaurora vandensis]|uniref:hypothetical protein n=1 Tax=Candidatus Cyanaurora vandensis TaxID=2714958 RepID=UPI002580AA8A|nr:hypothetical protein [Candidatus Cyanaurora vandensis]